MASDGDSWYHHIGGWKLARGLGIGALIASGITVALSLLAIALVLAPLAFWFAWNVLDFGDAVGLPELGFWGVLLATLFLMAGWFGKTLIAALVFIVDPAWFQSEAVLRWPEPTFKHFVALSLLAALAASPHARDQSRRR